MVSFNDQTQRKDPNWEELKQITRNSALELLAVSVEHAKARGFEPIFYASYLQGEFKDEVMEGDIIVPFVIAQPQGIKEDFERDFEMGRQNIPLESKFFELLEEGRISGSVDENSVSFTKKYTLDVNGKLNPKKSPVIYRGNCVDRERKIYEGKWEIPNSCSGKFRIVRAYSLLFDR